MDNTLTELVFVLDRSGSMASRINDVIGGFNALIEKQKLEPGRANVSLVIFDDTIKVIADGVDIRLISPLHTGIFFAGGGTALFDAIAQTTDMVGRRLAATPEFSRPSKVLVTVMTDGEENASVEYSRRAGGTARLKAKIEHQKTAYSWQYIFVGANMDAVLVGADFGVSAGTAMSFSTRSPLAVKNAMRSVGAYASSYRMSSSPVEANALSFSDIDRAEAMAGDDQAPVAGTIVVPTPVKP